MRYFCCCKGHVRVDYPMWKKVMEEEEKNSKSKVGINVVIVEWDQSVVDVCVTTRGQKANMLVEEPLERKVSRTRGQRTKSKRKKSSFGCSQGTIENSKVKK